MTKRSRNWSKIVLIAGALICVTAVTFAHRGGYGWWNRPDSEPIQNVTFVVGEDGGVQTKDGLVKRIVVEGCDVTSRLKFPLDDNAVNGGVRDGQVKIRAMTLTGGGNVQVLIPVLCADLHENYFRSKFWTESTATVTAFIDGQRVTTEIPVSVHGSIRERDGEYILWAEVRGVLKMEEEIEDDSEEDSEWGYRGRHRRSRWHNNTIETITVIKLELCAQADVPDDDNGPA